jgi:eukaryotic translation initiation factor 2C
MIVGESCSVWLSINTDLYLGADVGHPGPGVAKPSVTGLVFSYDEGATRYAALTEIQQPRVEHIESLQIMMERALGRFIELRKIPPRRIIFFRDGVSEGEYNTVATAELEAIQGKFGLYNTCA